MSSISAQAVQLLRDQQADEDYLFGADVSEIPAAISQAQATQKATAWTFRFCDDLFLQTKGTEFLI